MIILSFLLFISIYLFIGNLAARHGKGTDKDYLVGGRMFGRYYVALSAAASAQSGFIMTGAVGMGYSLGLTALYWPLAWLVGDLIFWFSFPDKVNSLARDTDSSTIPELLSSGPRAAPSVRTFASVLSLVFIGFYAAAQFLAAGKLLDGLFNTGLLFGICLAGVIVLAYCAKGGVRASIPTEAVQAIVIILTALGIVTYTLFISDDFSVVINSLKEADPSLLDLNGGRSTLFSILMFFGIVMYAFCFDISQPHFLIRLVAGKNPSEVRKAKWIYISFMQIVWISMTLFGILLRTIMPELDDPEKGLALFAVAQFNPFVVGIILAGIFAAIASSLDALILVMSSSLTVDMSPNFYRRMLKKFGNHYQISGTIIVTICVIILTASFSSSVFNLVIYSGIGLGSTFGPVLLLKMLKKDASAWIVNTAMISGLIAVLFWRMNDLNVVVLDTLPGLVAAAGVYLLLRHVSRLKK